MEKINYIPLGSIVLLSGGTQKVMIISRGLNVQNGGRVLFFDYAGVPYPEGLNGDQVAYFHHDAISRVVFEGYSDVDNEQMVDNINADLQANPGIIRGSAESWRD